MECLVEIGRARGSAGGKSAAIELEIGSDNIARAAATKSAIKLAEQVRSLHKGTDEEYYYQEFLNQAYGSSVYFGDEVEEMVNTSGVPNNSVLSVCVM